jgi:hypothetical protein
MIGFHSHCFTYNSAVEFGFWKADDKAEDIEAGHGK